jgi:hypothetical protein
MDFELTADQKIFRDSVAGFAARHLAEGALARARASGYPWEVARLRNRACWASPPRRRTAARAAR